MCNLQVLSFAVWFPQKLDNKAKVCFITAFEVYYNSLRELFPTMKIDCYIKKPITTDDLVQRIQNQNLLLLLNSVIIYLTVA